MRKYPFWTVESQGYLVAAFQKLDDAQAFFDLYDGQVELVEWESKTPLAAILLMLSDDDA